MRAKGKILVVITLSILFSPNSSTEESTTRSGSYYAQTFSGMGSDGNGLFLGAEATQGREQKASKLFSR
jgi:hypothetical protein